MTRRRPGLLVLCALLLSLLLPPVSNREPAACAQTHPRDGIERRPSGAYALTGARIVVRPGEIIENGTIVIRDGRIVAAGDVQAPADVEQRSLAGKTVTAGWIELDLRLGDGAAASAPPPEAGGAGATSATGDPGDERVGRAWSSRVEPEREAAELLPLPEDKARALRALGFTVALVAPGSGCFAGSGALVGLGPALGEELRRTIISAPAAMCISLEHGGRGDGEYPTSRMGAIALVRQTLFDARWHRDAWQAWERGATDGARPEYNRSLAALAPLLDRRVPAAMRAGDALALLSLARIASEHELDAWYLGAGDEFEWVNELEALHVRVVLPVNFPEPPVVERPDEAGAVTLRDLELWARAPENPLRLDRAGIPVALTTQGLRAADEFPARVRRILARGWSRDAALAAVTTTPAKIAGMEKSLGSIEAGKLAYLAVFDGEPFAADTRAVEVWIDGRRYPCEPEAAPRVGGAWTLTWGEGDAARGLAPVEFTIAGDRAHPRLEIRDAEGAPKRTGTLRVEGRDVAITIDGGSDESGGAAERTTLLLGARLDEAGSVMEGSALLPSGARAAFRATRAAAANPSDASATPDAKNGATEDPEVEAARLWAGSADETITVPLGERGRVEAAPAPGTVLVRGGTVWTMGAPGIMENADMLVVGGKITEVGRGLAASTDALVIDATGKHVTPGIIDPHSHTAIRGGVNETGQSVTAEVRIEDVIDPTDINIYRQLAGGVTAALLLHGSANPIGGQTVVVKWRWGSGAEDLRFAGAWPTIKFALGENVKQSNWGDRFTVRYPQTRMGVAEIIRDRFLAARAYAAEQRAGGGRGATVRRDLELDALVEILEGKRKIHCHSYRQDEILMLVRLAEELGFRVGTFQHVLEGYKVAPELAEHGSGASSFSDWWAYKFEVYDAIPHNGALLHRAGVVTTFNSDSNEMARRLHLEAAKAMKYGGVPREEAFAFVTRNGARQLGVDGSTGALEPGKDADFVVWSGDPMSTFSICLETWIEGRRYFSREEDRTMEARDVARKRVLMGRLLTERGIRKKAEKDEDKDKDKDKEQGPRRAFREEHSERNGCCEIEMETPR